MSPRACAAAIRRLSAFRPAVGGVRRVRQHAVVAPAAAPGEVGDRHQLERGDAQPGQVVEPRFDPGERAFGREGADVQLVDRRFFPWRPRQPPSSHWKASGSTTSLGAVHVLRIEARRGIGHRAVAVHEIAVTRGGGRGRDEFPPAIARFLHGQTAFVRLDWRDESATSRAAGAHSLKRALAGSTISAPKGMRCTRSI